MIKSDAAKQRRRDWAKVYYQKNKTQIDEKHKKYNVDNEQKVKSWKREWNDQISRRRKMLVHCAKYRAKRDGLEFSISVDTLSWPDVCPVLGIVLDYKFKGTGHAADNSATLDRLDPKRGYVLGNVFVVSMRANRIKNDATPQEIMAVARYCEVMS